MKNLVIIGAGDLGKEIVWLIEDINKTAPTYLILGFLDDDKEKAGSEFYGYKVLGGTDLLQQLSVKVPLSAVIAIQNGSVRKKIVDQHPEFDRWENIIHPSAVIASSCSLGKGNIIFPQVTFSVDTFLGDFGLYYIHASVGNDCRIGNYVSVMLNSVVGEHGVLSDLCCIAAGAQVNPHTILKEKTTINEKNVIEEEKELTKIVLIGAGGFGRETAVIMEDVNRFITPTYEIIGFLDDGDEFHEGDTILGYPWLGSHEWALEHKDDIQYVCTVGDVHIRAIIQKKLMAEGVRFKTIFSAGSYAAETTEIGSGCVIYTGVMISTGSKVGDGVLINSYSNIGHDVQIGDYTTISPAVGVSGGCRIGSEVNIGGHSYVVPGKTVGNSAVIGAGSIVVTNVKENTHVFGNPAKKIEL